MQNVKYLWISKKKPTHTTMTKLLIKQGLYEFNSNKGKKIIYIQKIDDCLLT